MRSASFAVLFVVVALAIEIVDRTRLSLLVDCRVLAFLWHLDYKNIAGGGPQGFHPESCKAGRTV